MRADATRNIQAVLRAAARVFSADPLARIADVAEAAGVDKRTVYRRFDSREDLLLAVYRARLDELESLIEATFADERPIRDALARVRRGRHPAQPRLARRHPRLGRPGDPAAA